VLPFPNLQGSVQLLLTFAQLIVDLEMALILSCYSDPILVVERLLGFN
jgi:hypothetical protein